MKPVKATFYLPLQDNDGRDLTQEISEVEDRCFVSFGGWTQSGYYKGTWRMETGERKMDISAVYSVILPASGLPELESVLRDFKSRTLQEAIYLEVEHQVDVRFL
jgi:hypothetical protein